MNIQKDKFDRSKRLLHEQFVNELLTDYIQPHWKVKMSSDKHVDSNWYVEYLDKNSDEFMSFRYWL